MNARHAGQDGSVTKRSHLAAALNRAIALCLVLLQLILSIGLGCGFALVADDFGAPSIVVTALLALGVVIGVFNAWFEIRHPESSYAIRWMRRRKPQP